MDHDTEHWKRELEKVSLVKKCPKCGKLSLGYAEGRLVCSECGFEQQLGKVEK
jgi:ribosomal protein S27AE